MSQPTFAQIWSEKVRSIRQSDFWSTVSQPDGTPLVRPTVVPSVDQIMVDDGWGIAVEGDASHDGPARNGVADLRYFLERRMGLRMGEVSSTQRTIRFILRSKGSAEVDRWHATFDLSASDRGITIRSDTEDGLLRASIYLSNYWSLVGNPCLQRGRRRVKPLCSLHIASDLWGGFSTTQAWIHGREEDVNFLELARMGVNAVPIMTLLEDYLVPDPQGPFRSLTNPEAQENLKRLGRLARQAARFGIRIILMGYNPKLPPGHEVFESCPGARGAIQSNGAFRTLCTSDPETRAFLAESWRAIFDEIPELGGILSITGGEGFYHCFMRSRNQASDCPRCGGRIPSVTVAELINDVARTLHERHPETVVVTWPYSAGHWSRDRDQEAFIEALDPAHVIFQSEVDKDSVDWRAAGYAKNIWDYSLSRTTPSPRVQRQRSKCRTAGLRFSVKLEINNSIECLNVPYLPVLENQKAIWENARRLKPYAIHSRWLFDGGCKSPSEELGYWLIWGRGTEFGDPVRTLDAIARRDFGDVGPVVRKAWGRFSDAMRHHPNLDYYVGSYFIGAGQPLCLEPNPEDLDDVFYGVFYWQWEITASDDETALTKRKPLFYDRPGFKAVARRGPNTGHDVALEELQEMARLWEQGVRMLERASSTISEQHRGRFRMEFVLAQHLAFTWRSAANVEEFLRLRDIIREHSGQSWVRQGHCRENLRDLNRLTELAESELQIARKDLELVRDVDYLDTSLRLDMGVASTQAMLTAKIAQVTDLLQVRLPEWRNKLES
ncbi:MAG: hypothetical protein HOH43_08600 [Candidatus Latescibacteria bacterium]|nr:hypothetical protein [Candidatus Latescibacterota bacterium]